MWPYETILLWKRAHILKGLLFELPQKGFYQLGPAFERAQAYTSILSITCLPSPNTSTYSSVSVVRRREGTVHYWTRQWAYFVSRKKDIPFWGWLLSHYWLLFVQIAFDGYILLIPKVSKLPLRSPKTLSERRASKTQWILDLREWLEEFRMARILLRRLLCV